MPQELVQGIVDHTTGGRGADRGRCSSTDHRDRCGSTLVPYNHKEIVYAAQNVPQQHPSQTGNIPMLSHHEAIGEFVQFTPQEPGAASAPAVTCAASAPVSEHVAPTLGVSRETPAPAHAVTCTGRASLGPAPAATCTAFTEDVAPAPVATHTAPVTEYVAPARVVSYETLPPVTKYGAPAPAVTHAVPGSCL